MALQIERPGKSIEYILTADRESSAPTKFFLRSLTWEEKAEVGELAPMTLDQAIQINAITGPASEEQRELTAEELERIAAIAPMDKTMARQLTKQHAIAVRYGVVEINGLLDRDSQPLKMSGAELARLAPGAVLMELGTEILNISRHSEDAIKK